MQAAIHLARAYRTLDRDTEAERWELLVRRQLQMHVSIKLDAADLRNLQRWTSCRHCRAGEWLMRGLESMFTDARPMAGTANLKCDHCRYLPEPGSPLLLCSRCRSARCAYRCFWSVALTPADCSKD